MLKKTPKSIILKGKNLYIPGMDYGTARIIASAFRSIGANAISQVNSDNETIIIGSKYTSGEECLPATVTVGNFMKVVLSKDFDEKKDVFFMPVSNGPCRFGQYAPYFAHLTKKIGYNVQIFSPTGEDGYAGVGNSPLKFMRTLWLGAVASDILRKMLHKFRPYETQKGASDIVFENAISDLENLFSTEDLVNYPLKIKKQLIQKLKLIRQNFLSIPADFSSPRPLIGVVGEIFCRLNPFTNHNIIRKIEEYGGEVWLSDISEWIWYTNYEELKNLNYAGKKYSLSSATAKLKHLIQHKDEHDLYKIFKNEFLGYEEAKSIYEILNLGEKYLDRNTAIGEMMLSVSKSVYLHKKGADGIIDISPFSCMNGIISETIYPKLSKDHNSFPIKSIYFDQSRQDNLDRDIPLFMEIVKGYQSRKTEKRILPYYFENKQRQTF